jgi:hypothetical protein
VHDLSLHSVHIHASSSIQRSVSDSGARASALHAVPVPLRCTPSPCLCAARRPHAERRPIQALRRRSDRRGRDSRHSAHGRAGPERPAHRTRRGGASMQPPAREAGCSERSARIESLSVAAAGGRSPNSRKDCHQLRRRSPLVGACTSRLVLDLKSLLAPVLLARADGVAPMVLQECGRGSFRSAPASCAPTRLPSTTT